MIDPIAFHLGPLTIRWYGLIMALAFALGSFLAYRRAARNQMDPDHIIGIITVIIPAAIIGARLYYVVFSWGNYQDNPISALAVWQGGLAIHGGIIGGVLAGLWYVNKYKLSAWKMADILAPSLILGQAIGRWGNFINQEAYGRAVSEGFISYFPAFIRNQMFIQGQYFHPTFLYESIWDFGVFLFLITHWNRKKVQGEIALFYLILYSLGRFFIEGLRTDSLMLGPIRVAQMVSLMLILVATIVLYRKKRKNTL